MIGMLAALAVVSSASADEHSAEAMAGGTWFDVTLSNPLFTSSSRLFVVPAVEVSGDRRRLGWVWLYRIDSDAFGVTAKWADSRTCEEVGPLVDDLSRLPNPFEENMEEAYASDGAPPPPPLHEGKATFRIIRAWGDSYISMTADAGTAGPLGDWLARAQNLPCWSSDEATRPPYRPPLYQSQGY